MSEEQSTKKYKMIIGVLAALLVILSIYTYSLYSSNQDVIGGLELQKSEIEAELEDLVGNYNTVIQENELKDAK